jgi:predicted transglutaminase-like cysteine proteinase
MSDLAPRFRLPAAAHRVGAVGRSLGRLGLWVLVLVAALHASAWDVDKTLRAARLQGAQAVAGVQALRQLMGSPAAHEEVGRIQLVNAFYNERIQFGEDIDVWGQVDYWASPLESLQRGLGDCEDYAIAKYFTLVAIGVPHKKLRMVYVRAALGGLTGNVVPHMVLAYYGTPDADPLVLDNLSQLLLPASKRPDLTPVFSFNAESIWEGVGSSPVAGSAQQRLSRWRDVLARGKEQGFL